MARRLVADAGTLPSKGEKFGVGVMLAIDATAEGTGNSLRMLLINSPAHHTHVAQSYLSAREIA
jgi:hypothetical protein